MGVMFIAAAVLITAAVDTQAATLAIRGRANATPSIAAADQFVAVAWGATPPGGATDVYAAVSRDGGRTFGSPVRLSNASVNASLGSEQPPRVSLVARPGNDPAIVVVWTAKTRSGTRLLVARSGDGGASYSPPAPIAASEAAGNRGWESTAVDRNGHVVALWLDHREMAAGVANSSSMHHDGHDHTAAAAPKADGAVRAQSSKLYFASLDDRSSGRVLTGGVCYCCKTAVASGPDGSIYAAWRHVYPGNIRDIAFTLSRDGGRTFAPPARVSNDRWELDGCPENGPALAVGGGNTVHIVWPTLVSDATGSEPSLALFYATTRDGRAFSARQRIATEGVPRHPQLIAEDGALIAAWDEEMTGGFRQVVLGRAPASDGAGAVRFSRRVVSGGMPAQTPTVASVPGGVAIAWTDGGGQSVIRVERR